MNDFSSNEMDWKHCFCRIYFQYSLLNLSMAEFKYYFENHRDVFLHLNLYFSLTNDGRAQE